MIHRGLTMGKATIMGTIPTSPQNTGIAAKPETRKYGATNAGSGLEAAQMDTSSRTVSESEDFRVEELVNTANEKGFNVIVEPIGCQVFPSQRENSACYDIF